MKLKSCLPLLGVVIALGGGLMPLAVATPVQAAPTTCKPLQKSSSKWPPPGATLVCEHTGPENPVYAKKGMLKTLQTIGASGTNAAERLAERDQGTAHEHLAIVIENTELAINPVSATYETKATDNPEKIAAKLAESVNTVAVNNADENVVTASASGDVVSMTTNMGTSRYAEVNGTVEKILLRPNPVGSSNVTATIVLPITWYDFANQADYRESSPQTGGPEGLHGALPEDAYGETPGQPFAENIIWSSIFESAPAGPNEVVSHTTAHETGHELDTIYGIGPTPFSASKPFLEAMETDQVDMQSLKIPSCTVDASDREASPEGNHGYYASSHSPEPKPTGGIGGFFTGLKNANGEYICTEKGSGRKLKGYSGDNFGILEQAFPYFEGIFNPDNSPEKQASELFAEEYSVIAGFPDTMNNKGKSIPGSDTAFSAAGGNAFVCTRLYVKDLTETGHAPSPAELEETGYVVTDEFAGDLYGVKYGPEEVPSEANHYDPSKAKRYDCNGDVTVEPGDFDFGT